MSYDLQQVIETFDTLSSKVKAELDTQYSSGRIKGSDYANVFNNLMNTILQLSIDAPLKDITYQNQEKDIELKTKQINSLDKEIELTEARIELTNAEKELTDRRREGYDDNILLKLFSFQAQMVQAGMASSLYDRPPTVVSDSELTSTYNTLKNKSM